MSIDMPELTISAFARLADCSRQNISALVKKELLILNEKKKLDTDEPTNAHYLQDRKINPRIVTNPGKTKREEIIENGIEEFPEPEKIFPGDPVEEEPEFPEPEKPDPPPKKKAAPKKTARKKTVPKKKTVSKKKPPPEDPGTDSGEGEEEEPLTKQKLRIEVDKLKEQREKLRRENAEGRAELVRREGLGDTVFGYLSALNQNILSLPNSFIDEFEAGVKAKKSRIELLNIVIEPITQAIADTKKEIKKEIQKAKREAGKK